VRSRIDVAPNFASLDGALTWLGEVTTAGLRHRNAGAYFPRVQVPDPLNNGRLRSIGSSGTVAGIFARTDVARGVWKAPAGIETTLSGVLALDYRLTDPEHGQLNPLGLNAIRTFDIPGNVVWGARTLVGADALASDWKYTPVRRLALFIEESLFRGLQWVVFEPNDEPLWGQIRAAGNSFMQQLFRQGAFQGASPADAFLVKCDAETTTQDDINAGIVNVFVGFAPLKPAEFVIISLQLLAGQAQA
jgi:phage tail sheath protein FI